MRSTRGQWALFIVLILYMAGTAILRATAPVEAPRPGLSLVSLAFDALLILALVAVWRGLAAALPADAPSRRFLTPAVAIGAVAGVAMIGLRLAGQG